MKRIILTTGGTGGHIFPALAVAEELKKRYPDVQILFVGGEYGPEADLTVKARLDFIALPVRGVIGRGWRGILAGLGLIRAFFIARKIIRQFEPDYVLGFGGYAAFASVLAARFCRIPTGIHEQNAFPGKTNSYLSKYVNRIFLSLPDIDSFPQQKCLLVGNPVRDAVKEVRAEKKRLRALDRTPRSPRLLIMGGSQGARALNETIVTCLPLLLREGIEIWHQTGATDYDRVRNAYRQYKSETVRVDAFIDDMKQAYVWADLVLCRAGGSSIAELTVAGLPSILVPFPHATHNHQWYNAQSLAHAGGAMVLDQETFYGENSDPRKLADLILTLIFKPDSLVAMSRNSFSLAKPDAAAAIVNDIETTLKP